MTSFEVIEKLKTLAPKPLTKVSYDHADKGTKVPFMVFTYDESNNVAADNIVYVRGLMFLAVLYLNKRDKTIEGEVEQLLNDNELPWTKTIEFLDDSEVYAITYTFGCIGEE